MKSPLVHPSRALNRRAFVSSVVAAAVGGSTVAGFVVRGKPCLMVVGEHGWQIALLLASRTRVLILNGEPTSDAMAAIPMLLSAMRQRIDVVIGLAAGPAFLPDEFQERWMVQRIIPVPEQGNTLAARTVLHLSGTLRLDVSVSPRGSWAGTAHGNQSATGIVTISCSDSIVTIGSTLEAIAGLGPRSTTVAIAPTGSIEYVKRILRVPAICINADQAREQEMVFETSPLAPPATPSLVRIFPRDVAEFGLEEQGITIPAWQQTLAHG